MHELFDEEFYNKIDEDKPVFDKKEDEFIVCIFFSNLLKKNKGSGYFHIQCLTLLLLLAILLISIFFFFLLCVINNNIIITK